HLKHKSIGSESLVSIDRISVRCLTGHALAIGGNTRCARQCDVEGLAGAEPFHVFDLKFRTSTYRGGFVMSAGRLAGFLAMMSLVAIQGASAAGNGEASLAEKVRTANVRFKDVKTAIAEGYAPIPCASGIDGGAMGVHYVNAAYLKDEVPDIKRPQAVMYE